MNCAYCGSLDQKPANCVNCGAPIVRAVVVPQQAEDRGPWHFALISSRAVANDEWHCILLASRDRREIEQILGEMRWHKGLEYFGYGTPSVWRVPPEELRKAVERGVARWSISVREMLRMSA